MCCLFFSRQWASWWDSGQKETHTADVQWASDLCPGENLWADQIPSGTRESETGLLAGHDWITGQSKTAQSDMWPITHTHTHINVDFYIVIQPNVCIGQKKIIRR